jgi:hypothetical protein
MSGPKRNPDKLNTIGVVVVGICGAVLVYVTIVALQAFYMNNTSEIQTMADYGGQDLTAKGRKADEMRNITEAGKNNAGPGQEATFRIPIDKAMQLVIDDAKKDPSHLIPALPPSTKASIEPVFGRPKAAAPAAPAGAAPEGGAAPAAEGSAAGSAAAAPQTSTGAPGQPQPVAGAGGAPATPTATPAAPGPKGPGADATKGPTPAPKTDAKAPKADAKAAAPKADAKAAAPKADATKGSAQPKP